MLVRQVLIALVILACAPEATVVSASSVASTEQARRGQELRNAARDGDLETLRSLLAGDVPVDAADEYGSIALHAAAERARLKVVQELVAAGADVNARGYLGVTPLHWAAIRGPLEAVQTLVEADADVNAHAIREHTPLGAAARSGNTPIVAYLMLKGADVDGGKTMTPLQLATKYGHVEVIETITRGGARVNDRERPVLHWAGQPEAALALLNAGADVNLRDRRGRTALHLTTGHWVPNAESVRVMLDAGAELDARSLNGRTPLHEAIEQRRLEIVRVLLDAGATVDLADDNANTPLSLAQGAGPRFVQTLLEAGARDRGMTPLPRAAERGEIEKVAVLIAEGVDTDEYGPRRVTALHLASRHGHVEIVKILLRAGARVDLSDEAGFTPLHAATNADMARALLSAGAPIDAAPRLTTPLYAAVVDGRADVVRLLLDRGAARLGPAGSSLLVWAAFAGRADSVNALLDTGVRPDERGFFTSETALHVLAAGAFADMPSPDRLTPAVRQSIAELLLERGAAVDAPANVGSFLAQTPLHAAASSGHVGIAELLIRHGAEVNASSPGGPFAGATPLHLAPASGHEEVAALLIDHGAAVTATTGAEHHRGAVTPLDLASTPAIRRLLESHGARSSSP